MAIRRGGWDDEECVGALLSVSFTDDPFVRWLLPNSRDFLRDSTKHPRRAYSAAFDASTVYVIGDFAGVAVWLPPGAKKDHSEEVALAEPTVTTESTTFPPEFPTLISRSAAYCPTDPHWYLGLIAVDPAFRGRGVGTKLMEFSLSIVDHDGLPAYLESTMQQTYLSTRDLAFNSWRTYALVRRQNAFQCYARRENYNDRMRERPPNQHLSEALPHVLKPAAVCASRQRHLAQRM